MDIHCTPEPIPLFKSMEAQNWNFWATGHSPQHSNDPNFHLGLDQVEQIALNENHMILFGSEDKGLSKGYFDISKNSIMINPSYTKKFPNTLIDSLNVGVSFGMIISNFSFKLKKGSI